ncbi:Maf family protein [Alcanivorax sediminis]|uniref:dTTP/UTP pyrophosphatase n=1 Tax=Alcanivorax sediminis TaxID=2663008 RepID=A0A6N7M411_9GAMM|nr:nucleoside triphosphate pyrophosphatase [Alcanivorax sediminis]MQX54910.1 septum formation inhibitor Maf [Alcanivorax sediminis]
MTLYLASGSPRRAELLQQIAVPFTVLKAPDIDERPLHNEDPQSYVERMAKEKSRVGELRRQSEGLPDGAVLGADTAVVLGKEILGKPRDRDHALQMLRALSGNEHQVISALALTQGQACSLACSITLVRFRELNEHQLARYVATGEGDDKAGGYGIQGLGGALVAQLTGSYSGVVGLPLEQTVALLEQAGLDYWRID